MPWVYLLVAGVLEVVWAYTMKLSDGFSRPGPSVVTLLAMFASFGLLSLAMRSLPLGTGASRRGCASESPRNSISGTLPAAGCRISSEAVAASKVLNATLSVRRAIDWPLSSPAWATSQRITLRQSVP